MRLSAQLVRYEPLRSLAFGTISSSYAAVGTPFANPVNLIKITNLTDQDLTISYAFNSVPASDGTADYDIIPAGTSEIYDYSSDKNTAAGALQQSANTTLYVRSATGTNPTVKGIYVTLIYASVQ